jgi:hypothetical protein
MNEQEKILAELRNIIANNQHYTTWTVSTPHLVALVNKFVQDEREECAKVCIQMANRCDDIRKAALEAAAEAIRARGTT